MLKLFVKFWWNNTFLFFLYEKKRKNGKKPVLPPECKSSLGKGSRIIFSAVKLYQNHTFIFKSED